MISAFAHAVVLIQGVPPLLVQPVVSTLKATLRIPGVHPGSESAVKPVLHNAVAYAAPRSDKMQLSSEALVVPKVIAVPVERSHDESETPTVVATASALPASGVSAASSEGLDAEGVRSYLLALAAELRRVKRYPQQAVEAGWVGVVKVRIAVAANGAIQSEQLAASSGYPVLDEEALDMVRNAAPLAAVPESLRGRSFPLTLSIGFDLSSQ